MNREDKERHLAHCQEELDRMKSETDAIKRDVDPTPALDARAARLSQLDDLIKKYKRELGHS